MQSVLWQNHDSRGENDAEFEANTPTAFQPSVHQLSAFPIYNQPYHPMAPGHSITARNLSSKFRQELR